MTTTQRKKLLKVYNQLKGGMIMLFTVDTEKLKRSIAYTDTDDLLYTLKRESGYLYSHNKNLTKSQYYAAEMLKTFIDCLEIRDSKIDGICENIMELTKIDE